MILAVGCVTLAIWMYMVAARGGFWRVSPRAEFDAPTPLAAWPGVTAIIPARDEAETVGRTIASLLQQDYPGALNIVLVDDCSRDATAEIARQAAAASGMSTRLTVLRGQPLPSGWTGKLWALKQGVDAALRDAWPKYLLFTDADIVHGEKSLRDLVARAERDNDVLVSVMAELCCKSFAERCTVPAFIFFFQMLYPFRWVNRPDHATAAAAGGCMLVNTEALHAAGGIDALRGEIIDDCALARKLKRVGPIWLGFSRRVRSIRSYGGFAPVREMVTRSAYAELRFSPLRLCLAVLGMAIVFLTPPLIIILSAGRAVAADLACLLMLIAFQPILRFYRLSPLWALGLPAIAALYTVWTVQSALQYRSGRGGFWKGRVQAPVGGSPVGGEPRGR